MMRSWLASKRKMKSGNLAPRLEKGSLKTSKAGPRSKGHPCQRWARNASTESSLLERPIKTIHMTKASAGWFSKLPIRRVKFGQFILRRIITKKVAFFKSYKAQRRAG